MIVENVDEKEFRLAVVSCLRALGGYDVVLYVPECADVARGRVYAVALLRE